MSDLGVFCFYGILANCVIFATTFPIKFADFKPVVGPVENPLASGSENEMQFPVHNPTQPTIRFEIPAQPPNSVFETPDQIFGKLTEPGVGISDPPVIQYSSNPLSYNTVYTYSYKRKGSQPPVVRSTYYDSRLANN